MHALGPCLRAGVLTPFARRLRASAEPARRELGALLAAAIADGDDATALKLAVTAMRGPDRRAEKILSHRYRFLWICNPKAASRSLIASLLAADPEALLFPRAHTRAGLRPPPGGEDVFPLRVPAPSRRADPLLLRGQACARPP